MGTHPRIISGVPAVLFVMSTACDVDRFCLHCEQAAFYRLLPHFRLKNNWTVACGRYSDPASHALLYSFILFTSDYRAVTVGCRWVVVFITFANGEVVIPDVYCCPPLRRTVLFSSKFFFSGEGQGHRTEFLDSLPLRDRAKIVYTITHEPLHSAWDDILHAHVPRQPLEPCRISRS